MSKTRCAASWFYACVVFLCLSAFAQVGAETGELQAAVLQQLAKLTASDGAALDALGANLAISGDTAVVGVTSYYGGGHRNSAYVFVKPTSGWADATETAELTPSDGLSLDNFGQTVAISGNTIFVGSNHQNAWGSLGVIYVFVEPAGGWTSMTETAELTLGMAGTRIGLAIAAGGNSVAAASGNQGGTVVVWNKPAAGWVNKGPDATLTSSDGAQNLGYVLSMSSTGDTILAYGGLQQAHQNLIYLYSRPPTGWHGTLNQTAELISSSSRGVGSSMAVSGNTVAARGVTSNLTGAVFVYVKPAGGWVNMQETAQLSAANAPNLAASVAVSGNTVFAGDPYINVGGNIAQGAAFVFVKPAGGWKTTAHYNAELTAADGAAQDNFGASLAASGNTVLVGAPLAMIGSNKWQGAAYVFGQ